MPAYGALVGAEHFTPVDLLLLNEFFPTWLADTNTNRLTKPYPPHPAEVSPHQLSTAALGQEQPQAHSQGDFSFPVLAQGVHNSMWLKLVSQGTFDHSVLIG